MTDASELIKQRNEARALVRSGKTKLKLLKTGGIKAHPDYVRAFERSVQKAVRSLVKIEQLVLATEHGEGCVAASRDMTELERLHAALDKAMAIEKKAEEQIRLVRQLQQHYAKEIVRCQCEARGEVLSVYIAETAVPRVLYLAREKLSAATKGG